MIAHLSPDVRGHLSDEQLAEAVSTVSTVPLTCPVCTRTSDPAADGHMSVIALYAPASGRTRLRYTHQACSPSSLVTLDGGEQPEVGESTPQPPAPTAAGAPWREEATLWCLAAREPPAPSIVLAYDLAAAADLACDAHVLLQTLLNSGLSPTRRDIDHSRPGVAEQFTLDYTTGQLHLTGPQLAEAFDVPADPGIDKAMNVARAQGHVLLVVGVDVQLGDGLELLNDHMRYGRAGAAVIAFTAPPRPRRRGVLRRRRS